MKKSKILKLVKEKMKNRPDQHIFICQVLSTLDFDLSMKGKSTKNIDELLNRIDSLLGDLYTLERWLLRKALIPNELITKENMFEYRQRFLDHLIKEYENKGE